MIDTESAANNDRKIVPTGSAWQNDDRIIEHRCKGSNSLRLGGGSPIGVVDGTDEAFLKFSDNSEHNPHEEIAAARDICNPTQCAHNFIGRVRRGLLRVVSHSVDGVRVCGIER